MSDFRLAIIGPGKMGNAIGDLAGRSGLEVVAIIGAGSVLDTASLNGADVAIEFTEPSAAAANIRACITAGCPVVVGTTGWYDELPQIAAAVAAARGALLWDANFSLGVHAVAKLVERAGELAASLRGFGGAIIETHHAGKRDAPSGTARMLQLRYAVASGCELPITSIRVGAVPGTHQLVLDGAFEQIVISHEARDRSVFAEGALVAARWLVGRQGVFTLDDMLAQEGTR